MRPNLMLLTMLLGVLASAPGVAQHSHDDAESTAHAEHGGDCVVCETDAHAGHGSGCAEDEHDDESGASVNILAAVGDSSVDDDALDLLQGGNHDPKRSGFTLQQIELAVDAKLADQVRAAVHVVQGEQELELEEAYVTVEAPEGNASASVGYILAPFGLVNQRHPHRWQWIDQPIVATRILGAEGSRSIGLRGNVAFGERRATRLSAALMQADDDTLTSFRGVGHVHGDEHGHEDEDQEGEEHEEDELVEHIEELFGGTTVGFRPRQLDGGGLLAVARLSHEWGSECATAQLGASMMQGPNASGAGETTRVWGADFTYRWQPCPEDGWPFVLWESEYMTRSFGAPAVFDASEPEHVIDLPAATLKDSGWYSQLLYGFDDKWAAGIRYERASSSGDSVGGSDHDPLRDERTRISPLLAFHPDERTRLRLQWNHDDAQHLGGRADTVWFGADITQGRHRHAANEVGLSVEGHAGHDHDDHAGHDHGDHAGHDHTALDESADAHAGHDHAADEGIVVEDDHAEHDHSEHDNAEHGDAEHDHSGHDHTDHGHAH